MALASVRAMQGREGVGKVHTQKPTRSLGNSRNHGVLTKLIFLLLDSVAKCRIPRLHPNEPLFALGGT